MTGTLIGGRARDLYPTLFRMAAGDLTAEGFDWGKDLPFSREYGRIETVITKKYMTGAASFTQGSNARSMRKELDGEPKAQEASPPASCPASSAGSSSVARYSSPWRT